MRILLQFPEGLKKNALELAEELEKKGNEVFISSSPCYGACGLAVEEARKVKADKIIHYGHSDYGVKSEIPVEYVAFYENVEFEEILKRSLEFLRNYERIGLVTTVQHIKQLPEIKKFLEKNGKRVVIGGPGKLARYPGQLLGCDAGSVRSIEKEVDCFLYFGGGVFHPLGASLETKKPFLAVDPFINKVQFLDKERERVEKRRKGTLLKAIEARNFGIICSIKPGQFNIGIAKEIKRKLKEVGKSAQILISDEINFESLENFVNFDCFINTACPRIAIDDYDRIRKPILGVNEVKELVELLKNK
jgi:2-(3-amino-3-carboxypropyl)histidine synthase